MRFSTSRTLYAEERTYLICARVPGLSLVLVAVIIIGPLFPARRET